MTRMVKLREALVEMMDRTSEYDRDICEVCDAIELLVEEKIVEALRERGLTDV